MNGSRVQHQQRNQPPLKPPGLPRHMSWTAGKAVGSGNKETILEKIGLMRSKSPSRSNAHQHPRNRSFLAGCSQNNNKQNKQSGNNGRLVIYENHDAVRMMAAAAAVPPRPPPLQHQHHHRPPFHHSASAPAMSASQNRPAPGPRHLLPGRVLRAPDSKLPPLPPGVRPRSPPPANSFGRVNGILLSSLSSSPQSNNKVVDSESVLSWGSSWSDGGSSFSSSAPDSLMEPEPEEEVYVDCTSSVIYLGNYRGSSGSEIDAYSSYYSSGSCKYSDNDAAATNVNGGSEKNRVNNRGALRSRRSKLRVGYATLRVLYFHESCDREDQEVAFSFGEEGEEASDEDESSTEGDHTYESLYDVIGSTNRLDRMSQPHQGGGGGGGAGGGDDLLDPGDDASFDDDLFDDSFDSASEDENDEKGGTLTGEGLSEADFVSAEDSNSRLPKTISAGQKIRKKLRRNWSLTKSDIREGINRIRKKSTTAVPMPPFATVLPVGGPSSNDGDYYGGVLPSTADKLPHQSGPTSTAAGSGSSYNRGAASSGSSARPPSVPAAGPTANKKTNWSLKSHFKKKSMSAANLKPGAGPSGVAGAGGETRKESSMFYLTLTIKSDEKPDSVLRRIEACDFGPGAEATSQRHAGPGPSAATSCPSLPENPDSRPRRRRSDADSESARSNSSSGGNETTGFYRIQSPSGESNSSSGRSTSGGSHGGSTGTLKPPGGGGKGRPHRLSGQSITRPKMAPPDPPKGAPARRASENGGPSGSSTSSSSTDLSSPTSTQQRPPFGLPADGNDTVKRKQQQQQCHKPASAVGAVDLPRLPVRPPPAPPGRNGNLPTPTAPSPTRPSSSSSSATTASTSSSSSSAAAQHYDRVSKRTVAAAATTTASDAEPPPLPPVPPSLRAARLVAAIPNSAGPGGRPVDVWQGANRPSRPESCRGPMFEPHQESHYVNPSHIFTPFEEDSYVSSQLADEPLYQFYTATVLERATQYQGQTSCGEDDYEVIEEDESGRRQPGGGDRVARSTSHDAGASRVPRSGDVSAVPDAVAAAASVVDGSSSPCSSSSAGGGGGVEDKETKRMSALAALELAGPRSPHRTLWCELPQVKESGVLETMSVQEKKLQEAIFEVITSEASYLKSLNILVRHFMQCPKFSDDSHPECVLTRRDRDVLFSDILPVRDVSEALLCDLEKRWSENIVIEDISEIILAHAQDHFGVYVKYCSNKIHQDRLLNNLKETSPQFCEVLRELENDPICQSLSMHSFLMLPMQRITRLPLLIDAIFHRHPPSSDEYENCKNALTVLNKVVHECNEGARKMERLEELLVLSRQLDFGAGVKALPLMSASRWLVKRGQLTRLLWKDSDTVKRTGGLGKSRPHKQPLHLFLFTDVLIITKKKGTEEQGYTVLDYCSRNMIQIQDDLDDNMLPGKLPDGINKAHVMLVTLLENREGKTVEMVLACPGDSERARWAEAVTPRRSNDPNEVIYEEWDCPQVQAVHPYTAQQPDELSLETSDVVNVFKKTADGWYQGERIRDGERGWFPGNFCEEIASAHVRARNLRQRYRLLVLSGSYLEEKRRISVGKATTFYVPVASDVKRRERKTASSVFAPM